jgi:hypothetical protein
MDLKDTNALSRFASHPLEMDCCDNTVEKTTAGDHDVAAAAESGSTCSNTPGVFDGKVAAGATGWASCRRCGVIRCVCGLLQL